MDTKYGCCVLALVILTLLEFIVEKKTEIENSPLESRVVWELLFSVESPDKHEIFFDNFLSHKLLTELSKKNFKVTGTIRDNRIGRCPLKSPMEAKKRQRCNFDYRCDEQWCKHFSVGRESTEDDQRPGRLVTVSGVETVTKINQIVRADRRMSIAMIVEAVKADKEMVR
ncbi:piggyBac transposable element-derived protein 3 [Trichonephila clavipes]|nr:piggyBac transposable element-derived protein 3 [Trichonephila clavipes]